MNGKSINATSQRQCGIFCSLISTSSNPVEAVKKFPYNKFISLGERFSFWLPAQGNIALLLVRPHCQFIFFAGVVYRSIHLVYFVQRKDEILIFLCSTRRAGPNRQIQCSCF